ncbi:hypothetical protein PHLGIDRAFT_290782 [Phlebiopsis gigantea 11061_1 CR5-6]|uniref:Uncharacterized protein n=1 Tax=Phlebiopsis gigantea (strain 11061_1 CR5-6) TaxID=745531 RepID=A0A0C3S0K5_PHLG1|nr:hypothetical protein PHLGIDRAFT_290782 [Phlebiopsis gigantea 11061_1 CR5-6]
MRRSRFLFVRFRAPPRALVSDLDGLPEYPEDLRHSSGSSSSPRLRPWRPLRTSVRRPLEIGCRTPQSLQRRRSPKACIQQAEQGSSRGQ